MEDPLRSEIVDLISYHNGRKHEDLNEADVFIGNGMEGDDADEFLEAYAEKFGVDLSEFKNYFHYVVDEPPMGRRVLAIDPNGNVIPFAPVSVDMLTDAARSGRWENAYPDHTVRVSWLSYWFGHFDAKLVGAAVLVASGIIVFM